jgi:predicted RNA-binding protein with PIN domain
MLYVIDGYNLLHAMGVLGGRVGPQGLAKARLSLLGLLRGAMDKDASSVTVVFDAANAPPGAIDDQDHEGIHVRFALDHAQADDLIESMIRESPTPKQLTVVSDDRRIQKAARRGRCPAVGCLEFLEELNQRRRKKRPSGSVQSEKTSATRKDTENWIKEFAHLDDKKEMKELFQPFDFGQVDSEPGA